MPRVSAKRQVTLPIALCREAGIEPGDEFEAFVADGHITLVKKKVGAARGRLKHSKGKPGVTDEQSRQSALGES